MSVNGPEQQDKDREALQRAWQALPQRLSPSPELAVLAQEMRRMVRQHGVEWLAECLAEAETALDANGQEAGPL